MQYFKVDTNTYLKYDEINKSVQIIFYKTLLKLSYKLTKEIPKIPTDIELLDWAKINYPGINNIDDSKKRLDEVNAEIAELDKVR